MKNRIDSSKGYIRGNLQWVTKRVNWMKGDMSTEELFEMCNKILNHANQQPSQPLTKLEGSETNV
nr:MAG TPA: restriction endonuclease [Caudoviricetes sp.]